MFGRLQKSSAMKASPENSDNPPSPSQGAPLNWLQWWKDTVALLLSEPTDIVDALNTHFPSRALEGLRLVITAGPTLETSSVNSKNSLAIWQIKI